MNGQGKVIILTVIFIIFSLCTLATADALFDPGLPTNPDPSDDAITVPVDQDLSWTNGADTETIDLYFADDELLVIDKDLSVLVLDNVLVDTYDPGIIDLGTEYFWRVVSHDSSKATTDGPVWSFTTTDQYLLTVTKGIDTHINDVELSWLPGDLISVFYKQSPNVVDGYQILVQDTTPNSWHPAALIDGIDYYYMVSNDEAPIIDLITDVDACAQSGVSIAFTGSSGATQHDLWVDGSQMVVGITSPYTYVPGDTASHDYMVQAINGTCGIDSNTVAGIDVNGTTGTPVITAVNDLEACALTGVLVMFTAGTGAASHDLWVDGSQMVVGITSAYTYVPGDTASHDYVVRAINGTCETESNTIAGTDANDTPDAPAITAISDLDTCVSTGVQITFTAGSGATSHDLYVDGSLAQSGISSPYTHIPGDAVSHNYVVRAINGTCGAESNTIAGTDDDYASGTLYSTDSIVGNMRSVCAGTFTQGSGEFEACRVADETQFNHTLTRNLAVMETEVTRQMWADLLAVQTTLPVDPSEAAYSPTMSHPVNQSTWFETVLFANLLSLQNGLTRCYYKDSGFTDPVTSVNYTSGSFYCDFAANGYRLLSEGEWEYAARAGTTTPFSCNETNYTGDNCYSCTAGTHPVLEQYAVYCANDTSTSGPVGSKLSNPWNLKDMHGNVYEWCWDCYGTYPSDTTDYSGPISGSVRMLRGGIWGSVAQYCRSAFRTYNTPGSRGGSIGFRLARSVN